MHRHASRPTDAPTPPIHLRRPQRIPDRLCTRRLQPFILVDRQRKPLPLRPAVPAQPGSEDSSCREEHRGDQARQEVWELLKDCDMGED